MNDILPLFTDSAGCEVLKSPAISCPPNVLIVSAVPTDPCAECSLREAEALESGLRCSDLRLEVNRNCMVSSDI